MASKYTKSLLNQGVQKDGISLLLTDARFQVVDLLTKRRILQLIGNPGAFGTQSFDAVMTPEPAPPITLDNIDAVFPTLSLIEMKTTRKSIQSESLNNFFFGATEREYEMARTLGDRYLFAFVVLNTVNEYQRPFAVLLTLDEVERRTRKRRIQYQVNFRSDVALVAEAGAGWLVLFGDESHLPIVEPGN